jgi:hypothetical protein
MKRKRRKTRRRRVKRRKIKRARNEIKRRHSDVSSSSRDDEVDEVEILKKIVALKKMQKL